MRAFEILTNRQLIQVLKQWELCAGGVSVIAITSRPGTAQRLRTISKERGSAVRLCLHEAIDTETPSHPRAFTEEMARKSLSTLKDSQNWGEALVIASDAGQSRAAAVAAAWTRINGKDDMAYWLDPERYFPNALVYARMLEAAGYGHVSERAVLRKMMKEVVLAGATGNDQIEGLLFNALHESQMDREPTNPDGIESGIPIGTDHKRKGKSILEILSGQGEMGIGEISERAEMPSPIVFDKLRKLEDEGLVERTGNGSNRRLTDAGRKEATKRSADHGPGGYNE